MKRLEGKRAAIVGAGSVSDNIGNGRAISILFAREGARVLAADRDLAAAQNTVNRITDAGGLAEAVQMDATDPGAADALVAQAASRWGGLDILVHVVGMSLPGGVTETAPEDWDRVFDVNLRSAYLAARSAVPAMAALGGGSLVFVSSLVSVWSGPYSYAAYEASKAGLNRLARSLARAHASDGIRSNVVMPGMIDTPHVRAYISDSQSTSDEARAAAVPMKRQGTPWEIAEASLFLASDAASYITGACLPVDGGLSA
ncbi:SDR family NAD(P)-dependent oxidoreductase [Oricola sp.]|uniref:SDR family NAD(P)-dependent oxidoreductase n=1 Tax=Oricola sp. TaxID=1979950 RepID=UPI003BABB53D